MSQDGTTADGALGPNRSAEGASRFNDVEVVGRQRQVDVGCTLQVLFLGYLVLLHAVTGPHVSGHYLLPVLVKLWVAMTFSVALRRFGVLRASGSETGRAAVAFSCAAVLAVAVIAATAAPPVAGWLDHEAPTTGRVVGWLVLGGGVAALLFTPWNKVDSSRQDTDPPDRSEPAGTIVGCSGGGIRSAAFSLGALQRLDELGLVASAKALVAGQRRQLHRGRLCGREHRAA